VSVLDWSPAGLRQADQTEQPGCSGGAASHGVGVAAHPNAEQPKSSTEESRGTTGRADRQCAGTGAARNSGPPEPRAHTPIGRSCAAACSVVHRPNGPYAVAGSADDSRGLRPVRTLKNGLAFNRVLPIAAVLDLQPSALTRLIRAAERLRDEPFEALLFDNAPGCFAVAGRWAGDPVRAGEQLELFRLDQQRVR
jgi:hypothetical protein